MNKNAKKTGIIMSTLLARYAWLGIKTETRRLLSPQPTLNGFGKLVYRAPSATAVWEVDQPAPAELLKICPYGQPGDLVYFKETWATAKEFDHLPGSRLPATAPYFHASDPGWHFLARGRTRAARFMPAAAARRFYELEEIELQPLKWIRHVDIVSEGFRFEREEGEDFPDFVARVRLMFSATWNRLHASHPDCFFENSPWVWVLKFQGVNCE